ncbi:MAG: hypothetical protein BWY82_01435 [Verrucomicrobia bacterium ADurb.Bin474]|nr:MAG: hypothetical protein BWY82_01435 [Verrucomicrobia bacterium ADurb.Bin474]
MLTFTSVHPSSVFLNWVFNKGAGNRLYICLANFSKAFSGVLEK